MNVLGLDLSLTATGLAFDRYTETIKTKPAAGDLRLCTIRDRIGSYLTRGAFDLAVIEDVPQYASATTILSLVHGVVREILARHGVPYAYVANTTLKAFATGRGDAGKADMVRAAEKMSGQAFEDDNQAEAWWLLRMGQAALGDTVGLTEAQTGQLGHAQWPLHIDPYGPGATSRNGTVRRCRHGVWSLQNAGHWLHPFNVTVCDKPPK